MQANNSMMSIPATRSFLHTLAHIVLEKHKDSAMDAPRPWVLLPNRRSCLSFERILLEESESSVLCLPHIMPLGDMDLGALIQYAIMHGIEVDELLQRPAMGRIQRALMLARPVMEYAKRQTDSQQRIYWQSHQDGMQELLQLYDHFEEYGVSIEAWQKHIPRSLSHFAKDQADLLHILGEFWPEVERETQHISPIRHRNAVLQFARELWEKVPPEYSVYAAGSTGTVPATASLLRSIANLPNGHVILPAYDLESASETALAPEHPQFHMQQLADGYDVVYHELLHAEEQQKRSALRRIWQPSEEQRDCSTSGISLIEAERERQQLHIASILVKEAYVDKKTVAVISPNQDHLRSLSSLLNAEHIPHHSAAEIPLSELPVATLWLLLAQWIDAHGEPALLLDILKHPFVSIGGNRATHLEYVSSLERLLLRGYAIDSQFEALREEAIRRGMPDDWLFWWQGVSEAFSPLISLKYPTMLASELVSAQQECFEALTDTSDEHDDAFVEWLDAWHLHARWLGEIELGLYPNLVRQSLKETSLHSPIQPDAKVQLLTPMEARLLRFDRVVLLDMNEGCWPGTEQSPFWLNDSLNKAMQLPTQYDQAGRMAHDVWCLLHMDECFLLRSLQEAGSMTTASRFWNRIATFLKKNNIWDDCMTGAAKYNQWASDYYVNTPSRTASIPIPTVSAHYVPERISVTQCELLQRDPYGFYAKHILKLSPLDPIAQPPDMRLYGILVHRVMERVHYLHNEKGEPLALPTMEKAMEYSFSVYRNMPVVQTLWKWRLSSILPWLLEQLQAAEAEGVTATAEETVSLALEKMVIQGRIDRKEHKGASAIRLVDYKTGSVPTIAELKAGYAPQLPLLALASSGGDAVALDYWKVATRREKSKVHPLRKAETADAEWKALIGSYQQLYCDWEKLMQSGQYAYRACPRPDYAPGYNAYAHIERLSEWEYLRESEEASNEEAA